MPVRLPSATTTKPLLAALLAATVLLTISGSPAGPRALAASGCADVDGDGIVHAMDTAYVSNHFGQTVPPAPPQVDFFKDDTISISDTTFPYNMFETATACQTDPLPKTAAPGGALAVDADSENPIPGDTVESSRYALVGAPFHVAAYLTQNPGIVGYQARLHWDEAPLDFNPRTANDNDVWAVATAKVRGNTQVFGPADDGAGSDAYVEFVSAPILWPYESSTATGPLAQFEFTCTSAGAATIALSDPGNHTNLVDIPPATEYTPALTGAQIICLEPDADDDMDGCTNAQELGPNERFGGRRDPLSFWDFIDLWTGRPFIRDKMISVGDIGASVARFGQVRPGGPPTKSEALAEALTVPTTINGYHASADRSGSIPGQDRWDLRPPDGVMGVGDHGAVVASFGHSCI